MSNDRFLDKAKKCVETSSGFSTDKLYVVWFAKTLQNWKALVSTDAVDGSYWEVTYNGDKSETYVDCYHKVSNTVIEDNDYQIKEQ